MFSLVLKRSIVIFLFLSAPPCPHGSPTNVDSELIYMNENEGIRLLSEVKETCRYQPIYRQVFAQQYYGNTCGLQTASLIVSANEYGRQFTTSSSPSPPSSPTTLPSDDNCQMRVNSSMLAGIKVRYTDQNFFETFPSSQKVVTKQQIQSRGTTLPELGQLLVSQNFTVRIVHASTSSSDAFRNDLLQYLTSSTSESGVSVNFHRRVLSTQMRGIPHHSPVIAYHRGTDRLLVLDTSFSLDKHYWVKVNVMFAAMSTIDHSSDQSRGWTVFSRASK